MYAALEKAGYTTATDIQAGLIPLALEGKDVIGQARTGTGKTASFVIPILEKLKPRKDVHGPQALIMVPTRELAVQVRGEAAKLSEGRKVNCVAVYGGKPLREQTDKLKRGADIVVGTPGRVIDLMERGALDLSRLAFVVLDEADRMLDIGFRPDIERILRRCPKERQTFLLSATVPPPIMKLTQRYMQDPLTLNFSPKEMSVDTIEQHYFTVDGNRKLADSRRPEPEPARSRDAGLPRQQGAVPGGDRRYRPRHRRDQRLAHRELRHSDVLRRLCPSRRPHWPHGTRGCGVYLCDARGGARADADRRADQSPVDPRRDEEFPGGV
jgi:hypothetical protein